MERMPSAESKIFLTLLLLMALASNVSVGMTTTAVILGGVAIVFCRCRYGTWPETDRGVLKIFLVYVALQGIVALFSLNPVMSFRGILGESYRLLPFFMIMAFVKKWDTWRYMLLAFSLSALVNDLWVFYQGIVHGLSYDIRGFNSFHNQLASQLLVAIPLLFFAGSLDKLSLGERRFCTLVCFLSVIALFLARTRWAWVTLLVLIILAWHGSSGEIRRRVARMGAAVLVTGVIVVASSPVFQARLLSMADVNFRGNSERLLIWQGAMKMIGDHPLFGVGQKIFVQEYNGRYISPHAKERPGDPVLPTGHQHPHNNFLNAFAEGGLVGLSSFCILYGYILYRFHKNHVRLRAKEHLTAGFTGMLLTFGLLFEGLTETNMIQVPVMRAYWLVVGLLFTFDKHLEKDPVR